MVSPDNPFSPGFGASPLYLAGRDDAIAIAAATSLQLARTDFSRATMLVGQRGVGKTVLLNHLEDLAVASGEWAVVRTTAVQGFQDRLVAHQLPTLMAELVPPRQVNLAATVGGGAIPVSVGISSQPPSAPPWGLREHIRELCHALDGRGLLFVIDEVNSGTRAELELFAAEYQHAITRGLPVALIAGGAPAALRRMLSGGTAMSFLARAQRIDIGILPLPLAVDAFRRTIDLRGTRTASETVLQEMAVLSRGYPFLIQQVGALAWEERPAAASVSSADVRAVTDAAITAMRKLVLDVILRDLRGRARRALELIAAEPEIRTSELGRRLGIPTSSVADVHLRLIDAGVVVRDPDVRGVVRIIVPYLADYLRQVELPRIAADDQLAALETYPSD